MARSTSSVRSHPATKRTSVAIASDGIEQFLNEAARRATKSLQSGKTDREVLLKANMALAKAKRHR